MRERSKRLTVLVGLLAVLLLLVLEPAQALIDPSFTPVHLVGDAQRIVAGKLKADKQADRWAFADVRVLKGEKLGSVLISVAIQNATDAADARRFLRASDGSDAVLFVGEQAAYLLVADIWMDVKADGPDGLQIKEFKNLRMPKTYSGAADKLIQMVEYILKEKDADVPVEAGVKWQKHVLAVKLKGRPSDMAALCGGKGSPARLFLAGPGGDRLLVYDAAKGRFEDRTEAAGIDTRSSLSAFVDLDGDGLADLVGWNGCEMTFRLGTKDGRFVKSEKLDDLRSPTWRCALVPLSTSQDGSPGLLVDARWPLLFAWNGKVWSVKPLPGDRARFPAEQGSSCVVADWDGDGYADVLLSREDGGLMWKGKQGGFEKPVACKTGSGGLPARWCVGDFDTDGRLDLLVCGAKKAELWENAGNGDFKAVGRYAGSFYTIEPGAADCIATDLNHDGRSDAVVLSAAGRFYYHFNRGYRCMADEGDLKLDAKPTDEAKAKEFRPVRAAAGDFNGDGVLDLAVAYATGEVVCYFNGAFAEPGQVPGLWVRLPKGRVGPVTVSVWQGEAYKFCVGTYLVAGYSPPTYVSLRKRGPCTLKWRWPGGPPRELSAEAGAEVELPLTQAPAAARRAP